MDVIDFPIVLFQLEGIAIDIPPPPFSNHKQKKTEKLTQSVFYAITLQNSLQTNMFFNSLSALKERLWLIY